MAESRTTVFEIAVLRSQPKFLKKTRMYENKILICLCHVTAFHTGLARILWTTSHSKKPQSLVIMLA